jgi:hypothetical protein
MRLILADFLLHRWWQQIFFSTMVTGDTVVGISWNQFGAIKSPFGPKDQKQKSTRRFRPALLYTE